MLIKYINGDKNNKPIGNEKISKAAGLKMETCGPVRSQRKVLRVCPAKRPPAAPLSRAPIRHRHAMRLPPDGHDDAAMDPCDNSNDSGLGLEHSSTDLSISPTSSSASLDDTNDSEDTQPRLKRSRLSVKCEQDDTEESANDKFGFSVSLRELKAGATPSVPRLPLSGPVCASTLDGRVTLSIVNQPEQQHRARYQTEGSRGAVKDRSGQGFPTVKLTGYNKAATLQVFIGSDVDRVAPHMFYQACKVCGKNSTPCTEEKSEGTIVIELQFEPAKNMIVTCDCVGILKERNVDVEHRFPEESVSRSKKKSTRCRMVFRTSVERPDGSIETLQVISQPIACTQLPGVPEINKRSLHSSPCAGGQELFLLGKNFLKDSRVIFQQPFPSANKSSFIWEEEVLPDKEFLQPTHLVCTVPAFHRQDISEPVTVRLFVRSSGKCSESQSFQYLPKPTCVGTNKIQQQQQQIAVAGLPQSNVAEPSVATSLTEDRTGVPQILPSLLAGQGQQVKIPQSSTIMMIDTSSSADSVKTKSAVPELKQISVEHQQLLMDLLRQCLLESSSVNSKLSTYPVDADPPMLSKLLRQYVSENTGSPLPAQSGSSVEKFLSKIENGASMPENKMKMVNNNESYVSSTSLDFPKQHLSTEAMPIISQATLQLKQANLNSKNIENGLSTNTVGNSIIPMQIAYKSKNTNFETNTTLPLQEVSTSMSNQQDSKVLVPSEIMSQHTDTLVSNPNSNTILVNHEPVIDMLNTSPMIIHNVISSASNSFDSQVNPVQINSQMLNQTVPCISDTLVQPLMTAVMMEESRNILARSSNTDGLLNTSIVDSQSQFQQTDVTLSGASSLMSTMPIVNIQSEISQSNSILPTLNQPELVSDAHIMNTQLGQLLTTDMVSEDHASNHALTGDNGSPLVRDVLLGSAPILSSASSLSIHVETQHKKEGMLSQDLTHIMSDKDLLCYMNPGCFDQVIP